MKKIFLILFLIIILSFSVFAFSETPINWKVYYKIGDSQQSNTFTLYNEENLTKTITLSIIGDDINLISLPYNSLSVDPLSQTTLTLTTNIGNASAGLILDYLKLESGTETDLVTIPINITPLTQPPPQQNIGGCSIIPDATDFIKRITKDTPPFTQKFNLRIANECADKVKLTNILLQNTIQTSAGEKPISLTGSLNLGDKNPGDTSSFDILFDVVDVDTGTYTPSTKIIGVYKNSTISATVNFQIQVTKSLVSPNPDLNKLPTYITPTTITSGTDFELIARELDPNFQPYLLPNSDLIGKTVGIDSSGVWSWKGYTNKTLGKITISLATLFKGSQIGPVITKDISIISTSSVPSSPNMTFEFFPPLDQVKIGTNLTTVVRDLGNNNIINGVTLYLNGQTLNGSFMIKQGEEYKVTATHPNYNTLDKIIKLNETYILITLNPGSPKVNIPLNITSPNAPSAVFFVDDTLVTNNLFTPLQEKAYTLKATANGFLTTYLNFTAVQDIYLISQTQADDKKKGNLIAYTLNVPASWTVYRSSKEGEQSETILSGIGQEINFTINKAGIYIVQANNRELDKFEIKSIFSGLSNLNPLKSTTSTIITGVVISVIIILLVIFIMSRKKSGGGSEVSMNVGVSGDDFTSPMGGL